jgi:hypothetical protein
VRSRPFYASADRNEFLEKTTGEEHQCATGEIRLMADQSRQPRMYRMPATAGLCDRGCARPFMALNSLSELALVGPLSGAKQTPFRQPPETGFDPNPDIARP